MFWGVFGGIFGDMWGDVWGCVAEICEEFWRDLGGKNVLEQLKKKRINKIILLFYFVICLIDIFGYTSF